jgi:hypothetical protein
VLVAFGSAACGESSKLADDALVVIRGNVAYPEGGAVPGVRLALVRELGPSDVVSGLVAVGASIGLACVADQPPAICQSRTQYATSAPDGSFSFTMRGADTKTTAGNAATFALSARPPGGSAVTTEEFRIQSDNLTLPGITFWTTVPSLTADAHSVRTTWAPLAINGVSKASSYRTMFDHSGRLFWSTDTTETSATFDARVLEDAEGQAWIEAKARSTGLGMGVDFTFASPAITYKGSAGAPPYRADTTAKPVPCASPLPGKSKSASGCTMTFDLGASRSLALLVLRDCNGRCALQASDNQVAWADLGAVSSRFATVQPPALKARYVRVIAPAPNLLGTLSVW